MKTSSDSSLQYGVAILLAIAILPLATAIAFAHSERPTAAPARFGADPVLDRVPTAVLNVCKVGCLFDDIQEAVNAAPAGAEIRVHRGLYKELPSRAVLDDLPGDNADGTYSFLFHQLHPNNINLIAVLGGTSGKTNLTIAGWDERTNTYANPRDVVIDVEFQKHVGIRCDKADGCIIRNLSIYHAREHNIYVLDQDGFITDKTVSGWAGDYPYLFFATDHGIASNCEAFGAGDGGIYPGGQADLSQLCDPITGCHFEDSGLCTAPGIPYSCCTGPAMGTCTRAADNDVCNGPGDPFTCCTGAGAGTCYHSTEVKSCKSYHNVLGYSGTQGDWALVHDTQFYDNAVGFVDDSETDHPNYPQNNTRFERNYVYDNNFNVYRHDSDVTITVFYGSIYLPVGTGVFWASGNANQTHNNYFWDNSTVGTWLASGQGIVGWVVDDPEHPAPPFVSSCNRHTLNKMFRPPGFAGSCDEADCSNAQDFDWDGLGNDNCWENNEGPGGAAATGEPPAVCTPIANPITGCNGTIAVETDPVAGALSQVGLVYDSGMPLCASLGTQPCFKDPNETQGNCDNDPSQPECAGGGFHGRNRIAGCIAAEDPLTPLGASGSGRVSLASGSLTFSFNANRTASATTGSLKVKAPGVTINGTINGLHRNALVGTIDGPCTLNGAAAVCQIVFEDEAVPGASVDTLSIWVTPMSGTPFNLPTSTISSGDVSLSNRTLEPCNAT